MLNKVITSIAYELFQGRPTSQKNGASELGLQRVLGCSYKTAWALLHKLRRAMIRPGRDRLSGRIEVDESYLGAWKKACAVERLNEKR